MSEKWNLEHLYGIGGLGGALLESYRSRSMEHSGAYLQAERMALEQNLAFATGCFSLAMGAPKRKSCAYCGMDDFAHNQCQRCGAAQRA